MTVLIKITVLRFAMIVLPLAAYLNHSKLLVFSIPGNSYYEMGGVLQNILINKKQNKENIDTKQPSDVESKSILTTKKTEKKPIKNSVNKDKPKIRSNAKKEAKVRAFLFPDKDVFWVNDKFKFRFNENGTGYYAYIIDGFGRVECSCILEFSWKLKGSNMYIKFTNDAVVGSHCPGAQAYCRFFSKNYYAKTTHVVSIDINSKILSYKGIIYNPKYNRRRDYGSDT